MPVCLILFTNQFCIIFCPFCLRLAPLLLLIEARLPPVAPFWLPRLYEERSTLLVLRLMAPVCPPIY